MRMRGNFVDGCVEEREIEVREKGKFVEERKWKKGEGILRMGEGNRGEFVEETKKEWVKQPKL